MYSRDWKRKRRDHLFINKRISREEKNGQGKGKAIKEDKLEDDEFVQVNREMELELMVKMKMDMGISGLWESIGVFGGKEYVGESCRGQKRRDDGQTSKGSEPALVEVMAKEDVLGEEDMHGFANEDKSSEELEDLKDDIATMQEELERRKG